jgi:hypothetical protein
LSNCAPRNVTASVDFGRVLLEQLVDEFGDPLLIGELAADSVTVMAKATGRLRCAPHEPGGEGATKGFCRICVGQSADSSSVGASKPGGREAGEQLVADAASRLACALPRHPPPEAARVQQRRLAQPPGAHLDDPREEQLVVEHRLLLEDLAAKPRDRVRNDRQPAAGQRFDQLVGEIPELAARDS